MTQIKNIKTLTFAATFLLLTIILLAFNSCNRIYRITHKRHPLPSSFGDTLKTIKSEFERKGIEKYIIYTSINGNCFGPSYSGRAKILWLEYEDYYCRTISKVAKDKKTKDKTSTCNADQIFQEFRNKRLDTVATFPAGYMYLDPATMDNIVIKCNDLTFERSFEHFPLTTSQDTTHILFQFLKTIIKE